MIGQKSQNRVQRERKDDDDEPTYECEGEAK